jgi:cytochrome c peroxidase
MTGASSLCTSVVLLAGFALAPLATSDAWSASGDTLIEIGRRLFFDASLSVDDSISCSTCHRPEHAFTDQRRTSVGAYEAVGSRNAPSLINTPKEGAFDWDGREASLEAQVVHPFVSRVEHGLASPFEVVRRVREGGAYGRSFEKAFGKDADGEFVTIERMAQALASYVRSLADGQSALDRFLINRDSTAISSPAQRGLAVFRGRAQCSRCHVVTDAEAPLTDGRYHALGVGLSATGPDLGAVLAEVESLGLPIPSDEVLGDRRIAALGRYVVTRVPEDIGKFRTPSLRNVAVTGPYFHDGSVDTLEAAVDFELYYRRLSDGTPVALSRDERSDLIEFLMALTDQAGGRNPAPR